MIEVIEMTDPLGELPSYEDYVKDELRGIKNALPLDFLASKKSNTGNRYVFLIGYSAYPLYALINEEDRTVTVTSVKPDISGYTVRNEKEEDDIVFPYLEYQNIILKLLLHIRESRYMWVPIFGASEHSRKLVNLDRVTFEKRIREVLSKTKE